ncbi:hypothetical protein F2Q69_00045745 [Brassica cretica]|uniref:Reverse transcriptase domain-containing protein n=1 Tax=Brassica cretica TaxID=69181 RepID=A0A8S9NC43_BRACR|nr:hypothetical protein F2Q69_00045745 [Brassica cretica]
MTHLSFADDLLIFIDGSLHSVQQVLQVLKEFEKRSGLAISMQKTSFYASDLQIRNRIQSFRESNPRLSSSMMQTWFRLA